MKFVEKWRKTLNNPFDQAHKKAIDDVKNHEMHELLYEYRTNILTFADLINEWIKLSHQYKDNLELKARIAEGKALVRKDLRKQEHMLEGCMNRNDVVNSRRVNETIDQVMEATQEWRT